MACQFGVMFFPKVWVQPSAPRSKTRRPLHFNVWDKISENEFADVVTETLASFPARPAALHGPHAAWLSRRGKAPRGADPGGFCAGHDRKLGDISRAASPRDPAIAYCQGTPLRNEIEARDPSGLEAATEACAQRWRCDLATVRFKGASGPT